MRNPIVKSLHALSIIIIILMLGTGCDVRPASEVMDEKHNESTTVNDVCAPPVAYAGENQTITDADDDGFETVTLNATGSSQDVVVYEWAEDNTILGTDATLTHSFSVGMHLIILTVTNACGASDKDAIYINVDPIYANSSCAPPAADAGENQADIYVDETAVVMLDGSGSNGNIMEYKWVEKNGLLLGTGSKINYVFSVGIHLVILTVTNDCGLTDKDAVYINVKSDKPSKPNPDKPEPKRF